MTLPTPITDSVFDVAESDEDLWSLLHTMSCDMERDAMHMAIFLYDQNPDQLGQDVREVMDRWRPRVEALMEAK